ncbi:hypothetical protein [Chitinophaga sp. MM2321]|uniref:hypothetical protein n=1 Tax=Chitinophaga sp. MM2321 TaxID=3137178 RepID=UPI0032D5949F
MSPDKHKRSLLEWPVIILATIAVLAAIAYTGFYIGKQHEQAAWHAEKQQLQQAFAAQRQEEINKLQEASAAAHYDSTDQPPVNTKSLSNDSLVTVLNKTLHEKKSLQSSVENLKEELAKLNNTSGNYREFLDTAIIYKKIVELIQRDYKIFYKVEKSGDSYRFSKNTSAVDSALALFPYYKDRVRMDPVKNAWIITTEKK